MSAIWGAIDLGGKRITDSVIQALKKPFEKCVIDRIEEQMVSNCYMGCGIQYFTEEAKQEKLPICNQDKTVLFTADVILDNRKELFKELNIPFKEQQMPDGELQFRMHDQYKKKALDKMLGAYAYAYYDKKKDEVSLVVDAVGNRCVYYMVQHGVVYFSSLMESLMNVSEDVQISGEWMGDFLGLEGMAMFTDTFSTPLKDVFRVAPGEIVTITKEGISKETYWNPKDYIGKIKYSSDEEYKKEFLKLYNEAVTCTLRTKEPISILLSGGLDSTSVACLAAEELKKQGRKLYSYTAVPMKGYVSEHQQRFVVDESEDVLKTKEFLGNLECDFIDLEQTDLWEKRKEECFNLEMPYKSFENLLWIEEALKRAYKKSSRMLLVGDLGNSTVSYGNQELYLQTLLKRGSYIRFYKELNMYRDYFKFSRKKVVKILLKDCYGKDTSKILVDYENSYLSEEGRRKYNCDSRLSKREELYHASRKNFYNDRVFASDPVGLRQIGELETKYSLRTGVIERDPTKDKRIFEFCLGIPMEQYDKEGKMRRLITCYMKDILPEHVLNLRRRGMQSADIKYRMSKNWSRRREEWIHVYRDNIQSDIVDCKRAINNLEQNVDNKNMSIFDVSRHMYTISCLEYMNQIKRNYNHVRIVEP